MTVSQDMPLESCTAANHSASRKSVAPSSESAPASESPTRLPSNLATSPAGESTAAAPKSIRSMLPG